MAVLYGMAQYSIRLKAVCAQAVYFLHSTMPSVTCLCLSDISVICRVTYFQFLMQSAFSSISVARQHRGILVYAIWDIRRC